MLAAQGGLSLADGTRLLEENVSRSERVDTGEQDAPEPKAPGTPEGCTHTTMKTNVVILFNPRAAIQGVYICQPPESYCKTPDAYTG